MGSRKIGNIEIEVSRYVACMAVARVIRIVFWVTQYLANAFFPYLILADVIHTVIVGDLTFLYFKEKRSDGLIIL
jgi:hypothetical protein